MVEKETGKAGKKPRRGSGPAGLFAAISIKKRKYPRLSNPSLN